MIFQRLLTTLLGVAVISAALAAAGPAAFSANIVIDDASIRLGDLFPNAGDKADTEIAAAPSPGARAAFDTARLAAIARAYRIPWRPAHRKERVIVERAGRVIERHEIIALIDDGLHREGVDPDARIDLGNDRLRLVVPPHSVSPLRLARLRFDRTSGRFAALIETDSGGARPGQARLTGRVRETVSIPVPRQDMRRGDVISAHDLEFIQVPRDTLTPDIARDESRLVGMTPRRLAAAGKPVRLHAVRPPIVVRKGALVTMTLRTRHMTLSATGRALDDAAIGAPVRVANIRSRQTVEGLVTGAGHVEIRHPASAIRLEQQ